jgi:hypothetical protein
MSELTTYLQLGFAHIVAVGAMDHILFLVALAAIYRLRDARSAVWVITAFTVGHSITLALAVLDIVRLPSALIEFLIPVTIVATAIENVLVSTQRRAARAKWYRPALAGGFGLIHGAGFANYLNDLFMDRIALPLFGFNLGIEIGQILVLIAAATGFTLVDAVVARFRLHPVAWSAHRMRVASVSFIVMAVASQWAFERRPW